MTEIRRAQKEDIPRLRELWQMAFGDGEEFLDRFFERDYRPEETLVLCEDGLPMTMLFLLPTTLTDGAGGALALPYVYALATHRDARGKRYARLLLDAAAEWARQRGAEGISTVPAEASLHKFFASAGFREGLFTREGEVAREELPRPGEADGIDSVDAHAYGLLREELLRGVPHVAYPDRMLELQREMSRMMGADLYRLHTGGMEGCAAAERWDGDTVVVKELLCPEEAVPAALALVAQTLPAACYRFRTPWAGVGELLPFGMVRGFRGKGEGLFDGAGSYLGLAFD